MTLCLWQLGAGRRTTLPYLMAAISQIIVSPSGAGYAIQLEDNSIMVLSTAELEAKTSIAGVQSYFLDSDVFEEAVRSRNDGEWWAALSHRLSAPAAIDPLRPSQILAAVSSSIVKSSNEPPTPYIQRFDISTNRHIHRQAITRNNATHMNESPDGNLIREPDVTHLQISSDGRWMATVEEWTPPPNDLAHVDFGWAALIEGVESRREVYLKFWRRSMEHHVWSLDTRIEVPHVRPDGSPGRIFALVAEPKTHGFATAGDDGYVRIWKPKTRLSDGRFVRGARGKKKGMVIWSSRHSIFLGRAVESIDEEADSPARNEPPTACMAYSTDGSILAVGQVLPGGQSSGQIHLIDTASGQLQRTMIGIWQSGLTGLAFLDQYLLVVSNSLHVWDLVQNKLKYCLTLTERTLALGARLAVNQHDKTFALALPPSSDDLQTVLDSRVLILRPSEPTPVFSITIPNLALALLPTQGSPGYVILDSAAEIRTITPMAAAGIPMISQIAASEGGLLQDEDTEAAAESNEEEDDEMDVDHQLETNGYPVEAELEEELEDAIEDEENDQPIVRPEQLAEIFDSGPSFALPPVRNLFDAVVGLYARKTRTQPHAGAI
jgi:NET1-associated nuclear protein 1 (U3 small nucleolar RNA-associated protein 17)